MNVGKFLRSCRKGSGLNQIQLAYELDIHQSDVSKIERGEKGPTLEIFRDWTIQTQSVDLGIAFLYGSTDLIMNIPGILEAVTSTVAGFINLFF